MNRSNWRDAVSYSFGAVVRNVKSEMWIVDSEYRMRNCVFRLRHRSLTHSPRSSFRKCCHSAPASPIVSLSQSLRSPLALANLSWELQIRHSYSKPRVDNREYYRVCTRLSINYYKKISIIESHSNYYAHTRCAAPRNQLIRRFSLVSYRVRTN